MKKTNSLLVGFLLIACISCQKELTQFPQTTLTEYTVSQSKKLLLNKSVDEAILLSKDIAYELGCEVYKKDSNGFYWARGFKNSCDTLISQGEMKYSPLFIEKNSQNILTKIKHRAYMIHKNDTISLFNDESILTGYDWIEIYTCLLELKNRN